MSQFLGFGSGKNGTVPASGTINTYAAMTATAGDQTVTTALVVAVGDVVLLHQTQHATAAGVWELVQVLSFGAGTFEAISNLVNSYSAGAQAILVPQYRGGILSGAVTGTVWNGTVGGIIALMSNGNLTISGSITATGLGFRGGAGVNSSSGKQGEGTVGAGDTVSASANGNGGGGGTYVGGQGASGGGGGGHAFIGSPGTKEGNAPDPVGAGGGVSGSTDLTTMTFGGGGGSGGAGGSATSGAGGNGGGIIFVIGATITLSGTITVSGAASGTGTGTSVWAGSGSGAGGSVFIKSQVATLGTSLITANAGAYSGSGGEANVGDGGVGAVGRIRVEACSRTGTTNPSASESVGGHAFCGSVAQIIG